MKRTPLFELHQRLGARMVPFAGYAMPLHYGSIQAEHRAVREGVGVFDVSHMGEFWVSGPEAQDFLESVTTNRVARLKPGRAHYTMLPNAEGGVVDDVYLYHVEPGRYLLVVNAANVEKDLAHLRERAEGWEVAIEDRSDATALLAVQGPRAAELLASLTDADLAAPKKNAVFRARVLGREALLARTGYTGED
ncbi:MAG TPA: glycine cleavage system protein T, partial [Oceanithermus sp.]|nr:glycine cleavage system protein T [Oceanithermus sp.]